MVQMQLETGPKRPSIETFRENVTIFTEKPRVNLVADGLQCIGGPVYHPGNKNLYISDTAANKLYKWSETVGLVTYAKSADKPNGNAVDRQGHLITCHHESRCVTRLDILKPVNTAQGEMPPEPEKIAVSHDGRMLNSPFDVKVHKDGSIWFSDPDYGCAADDRMGHGMPAQQQSQLVYCISPQGGHVRPVIEDVKRPTGLCFSPDSAKIYVSDSEAWYNGKYDPEKRHCVFVYDLMESPEGWTIGKQRTFVNIATNSQAKVPCGLTTDVLGNVYVATFEGVHVYSREAKLLAKIHTPAEATAVCFGGVDGRILFICAQDTVWKCEMAIKGANLASYFSVPSDIP
eukprot:Clim_evm38s210 gene=Clim_evmTU38s210